MARTRWMWAAMLMAAAPVAAWQPAFGQAGSQAGATEPGQPDPTARPPSSLIAPPADAAPPGAGAGQPAPPGDQAACAMAAGSFLTGTVATAPSFRPGSSLHGVSLSHTHVTLMGDDGVSYDVAMDNVFADGYTRNEPDVPAPLNTIKPGDRLELCGQLYTGGDTGIHWVHTDCGVTPSPDKPDGLVKELDSGGTAGANMEANQAFCSLWPQ